MRSKMKTILPVPVPTPPPRKSHPERGLLGMPTRPSFHPTHPSLHPTRPEIRVTQPSIPLTGADIEEVRPAELVPPAQAVNDITPAFSRSALSTLEAKVIVQQTDAEQRARMEAEVTALCQNALKQALIAMTPPPPRTDHGASVRWLLVGLVFGALFVYVLMAGTLREKEAQLARAQAASGPVASQTVIAPPVATTTSTKAQPMMCSATGESLASTIPTVDVDNLPKVDAPKQTMRWRAPRKATPQKAKAAPTNLDEDNPYNQTDDNPYTNVNPE